MVEVFLAHRCNNRLP